MTAVQGLDGKFDTIIDRLSRLEANYDNLQRTVKAEIMGELKGELVRAEVYLDLQARGLLSTGEPGESA